MNTAETREEKSPKTTPVVGRQTGLRLRRARL